MNTRKLLALMGLIGFLISCGVFVFHEIYAAAIESDARSAASRKEWREYSESHRCKIVRRAGFWDTADVWQCTTPLGTQFEVIRYLRDE